MKRNLVIFLLIAVLCVSLALAACATADEFEIKLDSATISLEKGNSVDLPYQLSKNGEVDKETKVNVKVEGSSVTYDAATGKITAVKAGRSVLTLTVEGHDDVSAKLTVNVPEYTIEIAGVGATASVVDLGAVENLSYTIKKDGLKVDGIEVKVETTGSALQYESVGDRIKFVAEGEGSVKVSLKNDSSVFAVKNYKVVKSLWGSEHSVNKELMVVSDTSVTMPGGQQYFLGVMDGGTKYVFKATLKLPTLAHNQSVGIGHTIDKNDASMWFGVEGTEQGGAPYRIYLKNYLKGWANGSDIFPGGRNTDHAYQNVDFGTDTVDFIIVRDGADYWYSIGGYIGTYTDNLSAVGANGETWVGIYSQTAKLTATNISYSFDEDEIAEAKALCASAVAKLTILNADVTTVTKGATFTYEAQAFGPAAVPAITWELDKTGMTAGADNTSITDGALTLAQDAAGVVIVTAKCGDKEQSVTVNISSESLADENEQLKVDGGIVINENGSITFPEEFNAANATLNETQYTSVFYSAQLKQKVKGDFELAFTINDLKSEGTPKVLVSLGATNGQLFFTNNSVSVKSQFVGADKALASGAVAGTFTAAETLNVVVKVVGGHLQVVVNEQPVALSSDVIRDINSYMTEQPVLLTIGKGTSCTISNIVITDKEDAEFIVLNDNTVRTDNGFTTTIVNESWNGKDSGITRTNYAQLLPEGNYTITLNVTFNVALGDGKFALNIDGKDFFINNKLTSGAVAGEWSNFTGGTTTDVTQPGTFKVQLKKIDNWMYFYIGNTRIGDKFDVTGIGRTLWFWASNFDGSANGATVEVSDFTVKQGATIITISGDGSLQAGASTTFTSTVIGSSETPAWSVVSETLTEGSATITEAGVLTFSPDAKGSVTVIVAYGNETLGKVVTVSEQPANQDTAIAESKGGVKQDLTNGKIIFDNVAVNGVADEQKWAESEYYAILNDSNADRIEIRDNFIIEFTVSNYVTTASYPKLMISLGAKFEQFYVVYNNSGIRIEAFNSVGGANCKSGSWVNSAFVNVDRTADHAFKIVCEDGHYKVFIDGTEFTGWNTDGNNRELLRNPESMAVARNIMMSTNEGTTCEVSEISVTDVAGKAGKVTATYDDRFTLNNDGSITVSMTSQSVNGRDGYHNFDDIYSYGAEIPDNCEIVMNFKFNLVEGKPFTDEAVLIKFGSDRSIGVIYNNGNNKVEVQFAWGGTGFDNEGNLSGGKVLKDGVLQLKIVIANGFVSSVKFMNYGADGEELGYNTGVNMGDEAIPNIGVMSFGAFIYQTPSGNTATISNIVITPTEA